jgi:hypothetical protein
MLLATTRLARDEGKSQALVYSPLLISVYVHIQIHTRPSSNLDHRAHEIATDLFSLPAAATRFRGRVCALSAAMARRRATRLIRVIRQEPQ